MFLGEYVYHEPVGALDDVINISGRAEQEVDAPRITLGEHERRNGESSPSDVVSCCDDRYRRSKTTAQSTNRVSFAIGREKRILPIVNLPGHVSSRTICLTVPRRFGHSGRAQSYPNARRIAATSAAATSTHRIHAAPLRTASLDPAHAPDI